MSRQLGFEELKERFLGCFIGECVGDSLGACVEGARARVCDDYVREVLRGGQAQRARPGFRPGQITDDSQLARELMVSYVACRGFDPADYAQRIRDMFALNKMVGQGRTTRDAALHLIVGIPWDEAAPPPGRFTAGNGSAMRAAPVGLFFYDHDEKLLEAARCQSIITHRDEKAIAGSIIVSKTVAHVLNGPLDIDALLADLEPAIGRLDPMACLGLQQMRKWLLLPPNQAVQEVRKLNPYPSDRWQWISPLVTTSVMWSLYAFLRTPSDYFESICTAISCGGDVDTTAAMTGAMSGALNGLSAIPTAYAQNLHDKDEWDYERFLTLAADTLKVKLDVAL